MIPCLSFLVWTHCFMAILPCVAKLLCVSFGFKQIISCQAGRVCPPHCEAAALCWINSIETTLLAGQPEGGSYTHPTRALNPFIQLFPACRPSLTPQSPSPPLHITCKPRTEPGPVGACGEQSAAIYPKPLWPGQLLKPMGLLDWGFLSQPHRLSPSLRWAFALVTSLYSTSHPTDSLVLEPHWEPQPTWLVLMTI